MRNVRRLVALIVPAVVICAAVVQPITDPKLLFFDQTQVVLLTGELRTYSSMVSTLGIMALTAAAAVCAFGVVVLRSWGGGARQIRFATYAAAGLLVLAFDDAFQLHEYLGAKQGVPQALILIGYLAIGGGYVVMARGVFTRVDPLLVALAAGGLSVSLAVDAFITSSALWGVVAEDGAKFVGIWGVVVLHMVLIESLLRQRALQDPVDGPSQPSAAPADASA